MIEATFDICARHTNMVQLMGMQAEMVGDWQTKTSEPIHALLKTFLEEGVRTGALRPLDTFTTAVVVYGMVNSALLQCFVFEGGRNQSKYIDVLVDAVNHWLINPDLL
jgi:hypothetical protein